MNRLCLCYALLPLVLSAHDHSSPHISVGEYQPPQEAVIVGQDPYHGDGQAHGLCFSVPPGVAVPPSLKNIYKQLNAEFDLPLPSHGDLTAWANQGVLLLNSVLTVEAGQAASHQGRGWG